MGRPPKYKSTEDMQVKIDQYFQDCKDSGKPPTSCGLAMALEIERSTLIQYRGRPAFSHTVKRALDRVRESYEQHLLTLRNPAGAIFALKSMGWVDKQQVEHTGEIAHVIRYPGKKPRGARVGATASKRGQPKGGKAANSADNDRTGDK